jgi:UDPglucose 6-dehydrogenase
VAAICEASGADVEMVADGIGMDKRIGRNFLNAGIGYGGSCFPKDVKAFIAIARQLGTPFTLLEEVERINADQLNRYIAKVREALWVLKDKKIAVWGMTFKPDTDDVRNSVAIDLINRLVAEGAQVTAYDPKGAEKAVDWKLVDPAKVKLAATPAEAADGAEALLIATEWKEFANQDFADVKKRMHTPLVFDGRNLFNPETMRELGFTYHAMGRPSRNA